jgi:hypothetical protein
VLDEFMTREKNVNPTLVEKRNEKTGENAYMGAYVTETLNAPPEQGCTPWKLVAFMPGSMTGMCQVIFQRKQQVGLPDPVLRETETKVAAPKDEELARVEDAASAWAGESTEQVDVVPEEIDTNGAVEGA